MKLDAIKAALGTAVYSVSNAGTTVVKKTNPFEVKTQKATNENESVSYEPTTGEAENAASGIFSNFFSKLGEIFSSMFGKKDDTKIPEDDTKSDDATNNDGSKVASDNKYEDYNETFDEMLNHVYDFEGGYSNNPNDNGGPTNYGIIQSTYDAWNEKNGYPCKDVSEITKEEAKQIYYDDFFVASGAKEYYDAGNKAYAYVLFDTAINHGVGTAEEFDQQAKGDVDSFMEIRKQEYIAIVDNNPSQAEFEYGWQNRWNGVYEIIDQNHEYENYVDEHKGA